MATNTPPRPTDQDIPDAPVTEEQQPQPQENPEEQDQTQSQQAAEQPAEGHNDDAQQGQQRTSSPPLPERHTAVTPGPRAARLQQLYAQSLRHTLSKLGWDNFAGCYPTVARRAEPVLRQVQAQMVDKLGDKCEVSRVALFGCVWNLWNQDGACVRLEEKDCDGKHGFGLGIGLVLWV